MPGPENRLQNVLKEEVKENEGKGKAEKGKEKEKGGRKGGDVGKRTKQPCWEAEAFSLSLRAQHHDGKGMGDGSRRALWEPQLNHSLME